MATCPAGHETNHTDFCDVCGLPIAGGTVTATPTPAQPQAAPVVTCPNCRTPNVADALFCEACGFDFTTGTLPAPVVPDGLKRAANGDFYVTGVDSGTVEIVAADGTPRGRLAVGRVPTNCLFDGTALYVTDGGRPGLAATDLPSGALWRLELDGIAGAPLFDGSININI